MSTMIWIFCIFMILMIIGGIFNAIENGKTKQNFKLAVRPSKDLALSQNFMGCDLKSGIALDESRGKLLLTSHFGGSVVERLISYRDIISAEVFEDGSSITKTVRSSQFGSAIIGGIALGGVGAIIGGLSGKKITSDLVKRIELRLVINDAKAPLHDIAFLNVECKKGGSTYKSSMENARKWHGIVETLIRRAEVEDSQSRHREAPPQGSTADELKKLGELYNSGVLTLDEFQHQKRKVLGVSSSTP